MTPQEVAQFVLDRDAEGNVEMKQWGEINPDEPLKCSACIAGWATFAVRQHDEEFMDVLRASPDIARAEFDDGGSITRTSLQALGLPYSHELAHALFYHANEVYGEEHEAYMDILKEVLAQIVQSAPGQEPATVLAVLLKATDSDAWEHDEPLSDSINKLRAHVGGFA